VQISSTLWWKPENWHEHVPRIVENRLLLILLNYKPKGSGYKKTRDDRMQRLIAVKVDQARGLDS
jgi:hypothetical protein